MAVHWRRGDLVSNPRYSRCKKCPHALSEVALMDAMDEMKRAVIARGEHHGQQLIFHLFTQVR